MHPILGRYGPFFLFSYTVVLGTGVVVGIGFAIWRARRHGLSIDWLDGLLLALLIGAIGGRAGFVWSEWSYFGERPSQILQFQLGGLTYHGALLVGLVGLWGWQVWKRRPFLPAADLLAPSIALTSAFGWFACWLDGCAFGREAPAGSLLAADQPDKFGIFAWRYQTQLLGVGLSLFVLILVLVWQRRLSSSKPFWLTLFLLSLGRIGITWLRGDNALQIGDIRMDMALDAALAILSLLLLKYPLHRPPARLPD
ncbi:MAG: prolipoprotein diacylglyceryl transferase [Chloroflexi bacterium]|nr:prolipoprotein diacylglyceryl transferase [Chloroflexota bacterium]